MQPLQLDPEKARELAQNGASILLLDVPASTRVGLDHQSFVVAAGFKGWKMVPPGAHYLSYNAASRQGEFAPTVAFLMHLAGRQVLVRRWSPEQELLLPLADEDEADRYAEGVRRFDFDAGLAPYALNSYHQWQRLTPHVSGATIARLSPVQPNVSVTAEADPAALRAPTAAEARLNAQLADQREERAGSGGARPQEGRKWADALVGRLHYAPLPRLQKAAGLSAAELTAQNLDKSALLEGVIAQHCGGDANELSAEFELAFAAFLYGQSLEGFAQWKEIMQLALACERAALGSHTRFFLDLLHALQAQFECGLHEKAPQPAGGQQPDADTELGGLIEELLPTSFLQRGVGGFLEMLRENASKAPRSLVEEAGKLQGALQQHLAVSFDVEELGEEPDEEYAPVIVET